MIAVVADRKLKDLLRILKNNTLTARVGILGTAMRKDGQTNAQIAAKHEYGELSTGTPVRSIFRTPITEHMQDFLDNSGLMKKEVKTLDDCIQEKSLEPLLAKIGIVGESIVAEGFDTGGFGKWKPSNMAFKKNHQTLVETQQMRDSVISEVVSK